MWRFQYPLECPPLAWRCHTAAPWRGQMGRVNETNWTGRLQALGLRGKLPEQLTEAVLEAIRTRPQGERYLLADGQVPGLALMVGATGAATWWLQYRNAAGQRRMHKVCPAGAASLRDARALARKLLVAVASGADPAAEKRQARRESAKGKTVRQYLEDVYEPKKLSQRKARNGAIAKAHILSSWAPLLDVQLGELTRDTIEKVLADRKAGKRKDGSRKTKDGTLLRDWSAFRAMLADAVDRNYLAAMPLARRPEPLRGLHDEPRVRWLGENDTEEEIAKGEGERARFFKALKAFESDEPGGGDFLRCVVRLALNTGMRRGEIVRLRDAMVKLNDGRIDLPGAICKSGKARPVHLNPDAIAAIKAWKEVRKTLPLPANVIGEMFPGGGNPEDTPELVAERWEDRITQREFPELCKKAGITGF